MTNRRRQKITVSALVSLVVVMMTSIPVNSKRVFVDTKVPVHATNSKPNIVLFIADDLGIGDIGCFGNDTIQTPNIDRIAREGARLTHHLSASSVCTPSRAALLTGRLPIRTGMTPLNHPFRVLPFTTGAAGLPANETTFVTVAKRHGYRTALIGKWHLGVFCPNDVNNKFCHHPLSHGFDYYYGMPLSNGHALHPGGQWHVLRLAYWSTRFFATNIIGGATLWLVLLWFRIVTSKLKAVLLLVVLFSPSVFVYNFLTSQQLINSLLMRNYEFVEQPIRWQNMTQRLVREGVDFIERTRQQSLQRSNNEPAEPFLLVMAWLQVHTKLHASHLFRGRSKHGPYGDEVEEMDWGVGQIVNRLEQLNLLDNTLIYFTSDNGGHVEEIDHETGRREGGWNGIYRGGKAQDVMDGGIRMPTVAMWRGRIPPGTVVDAPTSHMDLLPTFSAVWSERLPEDRVIDGRNIYPLLTGASREPPHRLLVHYCGDDLQAVRYVPGNGGDVFKLYYATPNWTPGTQGCQYFCRCESPAHVTRHDPPLLYNIGRDPSETRMLSIADHQDIVQTINDEVERHRKSLSWSTAPREMTNGNMLPRLWYQPCCNFPFCDCVDPEHADLVT